VEHLRAGEVTVSSFATVGDLAVLGFSAEGGLVALRDFELGEAAADHDRQLAAICALSTETDLEAVRHPDDIDRLHAIGGVGMWVTCEGGDFVEAELGRVEECFAAGARSITLVHYRTNELGDVQTSKAVHGGLTELGREVVAEMNRLGMIVDLAHATMDTTADAVSASCAPVMISHSHLASAGADHPRLLSADHARLVAESGGIIGAWPAGIVCATLDDFVDEICRLVDLVGIDHVAVGSDMDANFRPVLTNFGQFPLLASLLESRGLDASDRDRVMGGNFGRFWRTVLDARPTS
jgi:membrane dipeptidase